MATFDSEQRTSITGLVVAGQTLLMVVFTLVETVALGIWLSLVADAPVVSQAAAVGLGILAVGLVVEHVLTGVTVNGLSLSLPVVLIVGVSVSEAILWGLWLGIADRLGGVTGILVAGAVLAVLLVPQHTVEDNVLRGESAFASLVEPATISFSVIEAIGATIWLLLVFEGVRFEGVLAAAGLGGVDPAAVGLGALAIVLFIEHDIGVAIARRG